MEVVGGRDIAQLPVLPRTVYAISSGMMTENTLSNVLAPKILENPAAHCMFVGYSDPKSPAGRLRAAKEGDEVSLDPRRRPVRRSWSGNRSSPRSPHRTGSRSAPRSAWAP
jgi:hypothetical protein